MQIRRISARDTLYIRSKLLRNGAPASECIFEGDNDDQTFHLGAFIDGKLASVVSFFYRDNPDLPGENQYQLRGMATLDSYQGQGISSKLLKIGLPMAKQNQCEVVWCNARESAKGFYSKLGFKESGKKFDIEKIGTHELMFYPICQ